jgi:hypothetical protein
MQSLSVLGSCGGNILARAGPAAAPFACGVDVLPVVTTKRNSSRDSASGVIGPSYLIANDFE